MIVVGDEKEGTGDVHCVRRLECEWLDVGKVAAVSGAFVGEL